MLMLVLVIRLVVASRGGYLRLLMIAVAIGVMATIILMLVLAGMATAVRRRGAISVVTLYW